MEQPLRRDQFNLNEGLAGDAGKMSGHSEVPRKAGHILLHESPHGGEIALGASAEQPADPTHQVARTEVPAWYNVKFNALDQVVEQQYGQAFQQEQKPEQVGDQGASAALASVRQAAAQPLVTAPDPTDPQKPAFAAPVAPVPQIDQTPLTASNPIYNAMTHPIQAQQPKPIDQPQTQPMPAPPVDVPQPSIVRQPNPQVPTEQFASQYTQPQPVSTQQSSQEPEELPQSAHAAYAPVQLAQPEHQQISQTPMGGQPTIPHLPQPTATMSGAVNPSFAQPMQPALPTAPQYAEPRLPEGTPKRIDPQHLLPAARKHTLRYLQNPWVWLAIGLLMILYFVRSI
jgi:hypothetical protein